MPGAGWWVVPRSWQRSAVLSRLRERSRQSYLLVPLSGLGCGGLLALLTVSVDGSLSTASSTARDPDFQAFAEPSRNVIAAVGPQMLTFIGVVFSLTLVALQMAAGQLSPRVVRLFVRSKVTKFALAVFLGTFFYTLVVQYLSLRAKGDDGTEDDFVPLLSGMVTMLLVTLSVVMFVLYVHHTIRLMRLAEVIDRIAEETLRTVRRVGAAAADREELPELARPVQTLTYAGPPGALRGVHTGAVVRQARRHGCVVELVPRIGDFVATGTPLYRVYGARRLPARPLLRAVVTGPERTMYEDLAFGLRQLVDIAVRALSTSVNDPTTAVQVLDRIQVLLTACGAVPLEGAVYRDRRGRVRMVERLPRWDGLVQLAFEEIVQCGTSSPQVTRRLAAVLVDLEAQVPPVRKADVRHYTRRLEAAIEAAYPDPERRAFARTPDRQGIG